MLRCEHYTPMRGILNREHFGNAGACEVRA